MELHFYKTDDGYVHCFEKEEDDIALCDHQATSKTRNEDKSVVQKNNICDKCLQELTRLFISGTA